MSLPKLYLETTIPSYLAGRRSKSPRLAMNQEITEEWWRTRRHEYDLVTSEVVQTEVSRGEAALALARLQFLSEARPLVTLPEVTELARDLISEKIIPLKAAADAAHIAYSAVHRIEFLLTWNCKHINNPHHLRRIARVCQDRGLECPIICTPAVLLPSSPNGA